MILEIFNRQKWGEKSRKFLDFYIWFLMFSQMYKTFDWNLFFHIWFIDKFG